MSHLSTTSNSTAAATARSAVLKGKRFNALSSTFYFVAIAIETLGPWNVEGLDFIRELGRWAALVTKDPIERPTFYYRRSREVSVAAVVRHYRMFVEWRK